MKVQTGKRQWNALQGVLAIGMGVLAFGLLLESEAVSVGVKNGLATCAGVLIPSLFPFMVLSGLLSLTDLGRILSIPLSPFTQKVLKLPKELGAVVMLSLVGGYPVGAKSIAGLLAQGKISKRTAERMLCFCVNSGPSFLITAVGAGMFLQKSAGVILFATQTAATILIGIVVSYRALPEELNHTGKKINGAEAFVQSVTGAANAMMIMCSFAILFSGILALASAVGVAEAVAAILPIDEQLAQTITAGLLEVTAGCIAATQLSGEKAFAAVSIFVSYSGLSVLFQIISCFQQTPIRYGKFLLSRLFHGALSTAMALPLYRAFCTDVAAWAPQATPVMVTGRKEILVTACLIGMCTVLLLTVRPAKPFNKKVNKTRKVAIRKG